MRTFVDTIDSLVAGDAGDALTLPFDVRQRSRFRATLDGGEEVGVMLPRGTVLRDGDRVVDERGEVAIVRAAPERVSTVRALDPTALARACYHLGNRHVALQIGEGWARYQHDHVLDAMVRSLGLDVEIGDAPFEPEPGAYHGHGHGGHGHGTRATAHGRRHHRTEDTE